ncbi:MAG: N-acetylmuramoyl-L-alanine amidase [Clostridia bacterium]|nr:N-acetylmuramoyl-L-alanine amidase [Clostridia bacterium]
MNRYISFFLVLILFCLVNAIFVKAEEKKLLSKVIYIDPGHGGADSGAYYMNIKESDINLQLSKRILNVLREDGATVYLTRYGDYDLSVGNAWNRKRSDLSRRANIINKSNCDLYLSIHLNAENSGKYYGAEVYYDTINTDNKNIALIFQDEFNKNLNTSRSFKENSTKYLQRRVNRPGVLLEVGFLSNSSERALLISEEYQELLARVIESGVVRYFKSS